MKLLPHAKKEQHHVERANGFTDLTSAAFGNETFDVGVDTRTGVNDKDYQLPFRFNGKLNKLTFRVAPVQLTSAEQQTIQHARAQARD